MPIRIRLALAFALTTLLIFSVAGFLFLRSFRAGLETSLDPGLRAQAATLSQLVRTDAPALDLRAVAGQFRTEDAVAQVLERSGHVVTSTREAGSAPVISAAVARQAGRRVVVTEVALGREREPFRVLARPVAGDPAAVAVVAVSLEATERAVARVRTALFVGGALAVGFAGIGAWFLARAALRPVERMRREAAEISEHDGARQLQEPGTHDEIAALGATMNDLLTRLQGALARQRAFVADAGHELRTPLAVLNTELELADRPLRTRDELLESVRSARVETTRLRHLTEELLFLARHDDRATPNIDPTPMLPAVEATVESWRARAEARDVTLAMSIDGEATTTVDRHAFRRALDNVFENALRYAPTGSTIEVRVEVDGPEVQIAVLDEGPGFPPEFLPFAFERFRRADDARTRSDGGTGLGLAIVRTVALHHRGDATAANRPGGGAVVTVTIPTVTIPS